MSETKVVNKRFESFDVYIGRGSIWGNPFIIGKDGDRKEVIKKFDDWIPTQLHLLVKLSDLRGRRLGCFCKPLACHGDILVRLADEETLDV